MLIRDVVICGFTGHNREQCYIAEDSDITIRSFGGVATF